MLTANTRDARWLRALRESPNVASWQLLGPQSGMDQYTQTAPGVVIDLAAISQQARRVVAIYDDIAAGSRPEPGALDEALQNLDAGPRPPGQLGIDIAMLASGAQRASRQSVLAAIERLRRVGKVNPAPQTSMRWRPRERQRRDRRRADTRQLQLPGFDPTEGPKEAS